MLKCAAIGEIDGDPGCAKDVIADRRRNAGGDRTSRGFLVRASKSEFLFRCYSDPYMTQRIVGALIAPSQFAGQPDQQFGIGQRGNPRLAAGWLQ